MTQTFVQCFIIQYYEYIAVLATATLLVFKFTILLLLYYKHAAKFKIGDN